MPYITENEYRMLLEKGKSSSDLELKKIHLFHHEDQDDEPPLAVKILFGAMFLLIAFGLTVAIAFSAGKQEQARDDHALCALALSGKSCEFIKTQN